jgi:hypothetical protein
MRRGIVTCPFLPIFTVSMMRSMAEFRNSGKPEQTIGKHGLAHFSRKRPARILPTASCQPGTPTPGSGLRVRSYSGRRVSPEHQARIVRLLDVLDAPAWRMN